MDAVNGWEGDYGGMRDLSRLSLSPAGPRHEVHHVLPSDHRVRPGQDAPAACAKSELERLCRTLGEIGQGGVFVEDHCLWGALLAARAGCRCGELLGRAKSSRDVQGPVVPS